MKLSMKKKSCFSEESIRMSANSKLSDYLRQNPRLPKKMAKTNKIKYVNPTVRTVGQLNCGGNLYPTTIFGHQYEPGGEPMMRQVSEPMTNVDYVPCHNINRTFSNPHTPRPHLDAGDYQFDDKSWSMGCGNRMAFRQQSRERQCPIFVPEREPQTKFLPESESQNTCTPTLDITLNGEPASLNRKTSENGVQVNMFHCKDCRRHIKYGKNFHHEYSCTESDSETNQFASTYITCERKESMNNLDGEDVGAEEKSVQDQVHTPSHHESSLDHNSSTLHTALLSKDGWKKISLLEIRFITAVILTISVILHLMQIQIFGVALNIFFYIRNMIIKEEIEEKFSFFNWLSNVLSSMHNIFNPEPIYLKLF